MPDAFAAVLGSGRGIADPRVLRQELAQTERELTSARGKLESVTETNRQLLAIVKALESAASGLTDELDNEKQHVKLHQRNCDIARYAAVRAGTTDPLPFGTSDEHQGVWTPGRPFLSHQHTHDPETGRCWQARPGGAGIGVRPGQSPRWRRCRVRDCPGPEPLPLSGSPALRYLLRQRTHWWHQRRAWLPLPEMETDHLLTVVALLRDYADDLYFFEFCGTEPIFPCPAWAYRSARSWLADTPLMRALIAERRKRQRGRQRDARAARLGGEDTR